MLLNYSQLKAHYDAVEPIRGDVHNIKPFTNRRRKHEHMVMLDNGDIQIICYQTPVITVHPDSSFSLCHGGYITPTTSKFISLVVRTMRWYLPGGLYGVYKYKNNLWLRQSDVFHEDVIFPIPKDPMRFVNNESRSVYEPEKVLTHTEQRLRVDKDKSKQARAECKQFLMWLKAIAPVMEGSKVQARPPQSPQDHHIRHTCRYPACINKLRLKINELRLKNYGVTAHINELSGSMPYIVAAQKIKHMLTSDDGAEFLELLHHVADDEVIKKKTLLAKVNRIINHVYGAYYIDEVEIKTGTGNT
jgi:hypothetical protein